MEEIWKDIPGFEGLYQASNLGRVKNVKPYKSKGYYYNKIKTPLQGGHVYHLISLYREGKPKTMQYHRAIALAFLPNPENKAEVNHKDGNKTNNVLSNLEWVTNSENGKHAYRTGLKNAVGILNGQSKLQEADVLRIFKDKRTLNEISKAFDISKSHVCSIKTGWAWTHLTGMKNRKKLGNNRQLELGRNYDFDTIEGREN